VSEDIGAAKILAVASLNRSNGVMVVDKQFKLACCREVSNDFQAVLV